MMEEPGHQPVEQAGVPGKAAGVGTEVGVLRSSGEAPVMGAERRRDAGLGGRSGWGRRLRKEISSMTKVTNPVCRRAGKRRDGTRLGKPDTANPFVWFDEGSE